MKQITGIITNCGDDVREMEKALEKKNEGSKLSKSCGMGYGWER